MARQSVIATVAALFVAAAAPVIATVLVPADLHELAREALTIVHGRVVDVRSQWTEGRRRIETVVTLEVRATLKGQPGETVSVRVPGGDMGRYTNVMIGAPRFREGEEVVLFLGGRAPALPHLLGLGQGVYRVIREPGTGRAFVTPPALAASAPGPVVRGDATRRAVGIDEFTRQVKQALGAARDRQPAVRAPQVGRGR
jgi:hypothetical protein